MTVPRTVVRLVLLGFLIVAGGAVVGAGTAFLVALLRSRPPPAYAQYVVPVPAANDAPASFVQQQLP